MGELVCVCVTLGMYAPLYLEYHCNIDIYINAVHIAVVFFSSLNGHSDAIQTHLWWPQHGLGHHKCVSDWQTTVLPPEPQSANDILNTTLSLFSFSLHSVTQVQCNFQMSVRCV